MEQVQNCWGFQVQKKNMKIILTCNLSHTKGNEKIMENQNSLKVELNHFLVLRIHAENCEDKKNTLGMDSHTLGNINAIHKI